MMDPVGNHQATAPALGEDRYAALDVSVSHHTEPEELAMTALDMPL